MLSTTLPKPCSTSGLVGLYEISSNVNSGLTIQVGICNLDLGLDLDSSMDTRLSPEVRKPSSGPGKNSFLKIAIK